MRLEPMRYKGYTWPYNPEIYKVEYRRKVVAHKVPMGGYYLQNLGVTCRIFRGEGTFAGEGAYEQFQELEQVFCQDGAGLLVHPVWKTSNAYFVTLELLEKPLPDYVRYSFTFWEDNGGYNGKLEADGGAVNGENDISPGQAPAQTVYIVKRGDTLWGIAREHGISLAALIAANPQIKNPNLIYPGNRVNLP